MPAADLAARIRAGLADAADPALAPGMQAYMKSAMPYLGVRVPQVRTIVRAADRQTPFDEPGQVVAAAELLWDEAGHREERYAALAVLDVPSARRLRGPDLLVLHERLIREGAWWDLVDELSHRVGELLVHWPETVEPAVRAWQRDDNLWVRRASVMCQVGLKHRTDRALLADAITANASAPSFWLRKAIGWALRDLSGTDPEWVRALVDTHELSPLSRREALKHLG